MIKALAIIFGCLAFGSLIVTLTGLKFPASIIGLLTLFGLLQLGVVKVESIKAISDTLLGNLILLTLPPCVAIVQYLDILAQDGLAIILASLGSTFLVLVVTAHLHQWLCKRHKANALSPDDGT